MYRQTRPFQSKGKAGPAKHKVSNTMEDQLGYVLRICVRETELPPTHPNPCFKGARGGAEGGKGLLNAVLLIRLPQSVGHSILCVLCAA